ncbi:cytochrome P450 [Artomyces pyxidatus]|uniref:Cytochrome P450 n=1 Tax=Artomyces pyxidatus TaxID=48021 RepID=A0ACB8TES6_9AGAM|nr:cytochrome P450 [Artomyces pyxidatus]
MSGTEDIHTFPFAPASNNSSLSSRLTSAIQQNHDLVLCVAAALSVVLVVRYLASPWRRLPPGPRGWPLIGNALSLRQAQWLTFTEWQKTYGDVIYLSALGQPIIVLNTQKAAADLLDRRAGIYSDRPNNIVAASILCGGMAIVFQSYGSLWRRMRRATHEGLNRGVPGPFRPAQLKEAVILALNMLKKPSDWDSHIRCGSSSMVMSVTYDTPPITSWGDQRLKGVNDFSAQIGRTALPGAHLVEVFTWMKYIPRRFAKWKREAEDGFANFSVLCEGLYNRVGVDLTNGIDRPSLSASLIKGADRNQLSVRENAWLVYIAGSETSSAALAWWTLGVVAYPESQRRAQAELDAVVGRARLPTFADLPHLPYVRGMVKEALRWRPMDPLGLPHRSTQDDWYRGMFIPAGTVCIPNVWAMNRDPALYGADAHHFEPARFLDEKGGLKAGPPDSVQEGHTSYGHGRRVCAGKHVANDSLFVNIAVVLWACTLEPAKDDRGEAIPIDVDGWIDVGLVVRPMPFGCSITPRFPEALSILVGWIRLDSLFVTIGGDE